MPFVYDYDFVHDLPPEEVTALLGGKAANLSIMARELSLPVPPAFTVTTEACRMYMTHGWPDGLDQELREHMARMEAAVGRRFGGPGDPLLVSVRSGAPISMPGMMDTILNLGLNDETTAGLAAASGKPDFAQNCRARFDAMFTDICGEAPPSDPWAQLRSAIEAVFRSWNSDRARAYRQREGISDALGTGVTVQAMVFGNLSAESATGVLFTRNPATGAPELFGDIMFNAQGEDVVAGTHQTEPISILDERMPDVARQLRTMAERLERHHRDVCDIEFTIERGQLWMLQCRIGKRSPQAALRIARDMAQSPDFPLTRAEAVERVRDILAEPPRVAVDRPQVSPIAVGIPASPGVASGGIVMSPDAAVAAAAAGERVILVRAETSPDDVRGMAAAAGILTSTGGRASHAAVVARGWGIPAVVGAATITVDDSGITIGERRLEAGAPLSIDGATGEVFEGLVDTGTAVAPEAADLLDWARELGVEPGPVDGTAEPNLAAGGGLGLPPDLSGHPVGTDDVLIVLLVKGHATPDATAAALLASLDATTAVIERIIADGLAVGDGGPLRLTTAGKFAAREAIARSQEAWGDGAADDALDAFVLLDQRMKSTITAWQMRDFDGEQVVNDHADAEYDGRVLADLDELHADARSWLAPIAARMPRFAAYLARLQHAIASSRAGDARFVASPRVDSYHTIWFELHEDLILCAGRTRAEEIAAGRA